MGKYKICVYAICKNEEKFVSRFVESMKEADEIIVLDTGSTDKTVEKLKELGVKVYQKEIKPWRFDVARNESLKYIPKDIDFCCCVDLDEYFNKGWRNELEKHINNKVIRVRYRYTWNFNADGSEGVVFFADKIHKNNKFVWEHPVHETLKQIDDTQGEIITVPTLQLNHKADNTKSRSNYLPLLELSVKEEPTSDRNVHYLGREYYFYSQCENAIKTLKYHLKMPNSVWDEERSASCKYIALCYEKLNKPTSAEKYFNLAISESPNTREPYMELAKYYFRKKQYLKSCVTLLSLLKINHRTLNYMSAPDCWNETPYDLLAICYFYIKNYKQALIYGKLACEINPKEARLRENLIFYLNKCKSKNIEI